MRRIPGLALLAAASVLLAAIVASTFDVEAQGARKAKAKVKSTPVLEAHGWKYSRAAGLPTLQYSAPGTDHVLIAFSCEREAGLLRVVTSMGSRGVRAGDSAPIRLSSGRVRFEIAGTAFFPEGRDTVDIGGSTRIDSKLFETLRAGDTVRLEVPGRRRTLPAGAMNKLVDAFEKACAGSV